VSVLTRGLPGKLLLCLEVHGNVWLFHPAYKELFFKSLLQIWCMKFMYMIRRLFNLLTLNVNYSGRTAPLTSKVAFYIFIQQI